MTLNGNSTSKILIDKEEHINHNDEAKILNVRLDFN